MNDDELFEKIMNKELTICETCDTIFEYIPQKRFCDECNLKRLHKYREENREKKNARARNYREEKSKDPEWVEKRNARQRKYFERNREKINAYARARYHANKKQKKENDEELFEKIMNKELTICETCDTIFEYIPQKRFCDECNLKRLHKYREENREEKNARARNYREEKSKDPEWVEKMKAYDRKRYAENRKDPEWVEKENARRLAQYHANKKQKKE
jgi:DNA-directed RNA polymerase subunit RPC12/RpoP